MKSPLDHSRYAWTRQLPADKKPSIEQLADQAQKQAQQAAVKTVNRILAANGLPLYQGAPA